MTKIDLITGILGSGKTTFLRRYAKHLAGHGQKIAILLNDFGAVNVDMMMLQELKSENCNLEMLVGGGDQHCHRRRFKTQLISLGMQHFDRVIIEPSGIYDMDEFFDTLYESPLDRWFEIGSILTVADAETEQQLSPEMRYLLASEAACCGKLILSKRSFVPEQTDAEIAARILKIFNSALRSISCARQFSPDDLMMKEWDTLTDVDFSALMQAGYRSESYVKQFRPEELRSAVHYFLHLRIPESEIANTVGRILHSPVTGTVFRVKGSLPAENGWLKINATADRIEIAPVPDGQAVLIVIGEHLNRAEIDRILLEVNHDPEFVSI